MYSQVNHSFTINVGFKEVLISWTCLCISAGFQLAKNFGNRGNQNYPDPKVRMADPRVRRMALVTGSSNIECVPAGNQPEMQK